MGLYSAERRHAVTRKNYVIFPDSSIHFTLVTLCIHIYTLYIHRNEPISVPKWYTNLPTQKNNIYFMRRNIHIKGSLIERIFLFINTNSDLIYSVKLFDRNQYLSCYQYLQRNKVALFCYHNYFGSYNCRQIFSHQRIA